MISNRLKPVLGITLSACLFAACSSNNNSNSNNNGSSSSSIPSVPASVAITGKAVKGLISGGVVSVYPVVNGALDESTSLGTATTDDAGAYSISIENYDGSPVAVRVTAADDGSTQMKCDLAAGCGDVPFGGSVGITDTSFNLDAIVPSVSTESVSVNLSVLTDTASELALSALSAGSNAADASVVIANSNSAVANRMGIIGNLTELPVIDITNPSEVANVDEDVLEYNLYNAAIVEAVIGGNQEETITSAINSFAQQYANGGGIADTEDSESATVTLAEILQTSSSVITAISNAEGGDQLNLSSLATQLTANADQASQGSTEPSDGSLGDGQGEVSELLMVKRMVNDLRALGNGINMTEADSFAEQIDMAGETFDADSGAVIEAMAIAAGAMSYAWEARMDDDTLNTYFHEETELTISISEDSGIVTYSIDADVPVDGVEVAVVLSGVDNNSTMDIVENEVEETSGLRNITTDLDFSVDMSLTGEASSSLVAMQIVEGSFTGSLVGDIAEQRDDSGTSANGGDSDTESFELVDLVFDLEISLKELSSADPITFEGNLGLSVASLSLDIEETDSNTYDQNGYWNGMATWSESAMVGAVSFTLSGGFTSESGKSVMASLAVLAGASDLEYVCSGSEGYVEGEWTYQDSCTEESEQAYVDINFTLAFSLDVTGISDDVSVSITGTRTDLENATVDLEVSHDAAMFELEFDSTNQTDSTSSFTITNQAGVVATLTETQTANGESVSGSIVFNGITYAAIDDDLGFVRIAYIDGSNESL